MDLGLIDMRGRVYDPLAGRFTTQDPVMQAPFWSQGLNPYSYVFNDPINNTDPSGFDAAGTIVGGIVGAGHIASAGLIAYGFGGGWAGVAQLRLGVGGDLGVSKLVGDPFGGSGPKSQSVAAGAHTSNVKGGGNGGTGAPGQNAPGILALPPGTPDGMRMCDSGQCLAQNKSPFPLYEGAAPGVPNHYDPPGGIRSMQLEPDLVPSSAPPSDFLSKVREAYAAVRAFFRSLRSAGGSDGTRAVQAVGPGPYAGDSIPARGPSRQFTRAERNAVNKDRTNYGMSYLWYHYARYGQR